MHMALKGILVCTVIFNLVVFVHYIQDCICPAFLSVF